MKEAVVFIQEAVVSLLAFSLVIGLCVLLDYLICLAFNFVWIRTG